MLLLLLLLSRFSRVRLCASLCPTTNAEEAEVEWFYQDLLELTPKKRCHFHHRELEYKSRKSRDTWSNSQVWPWSTNWNRAKANGVLPRKHTSHSKHPLPKAQEKTLHMDITRWPIPKSDWLYFLHRRWRSSIQSAKTKDQELTVAHIMNSIAKFRLKLKKVRKTTRPFKYDLNQILYDYTMEVTNRFKGLDQ